MVLITFSVFSRKYTFWANLVQKIKKKNKLELKFGTKTNLNTQNSMVIFTFSVLEPKAPPSKSARSFQIYYIYCPCLFPLFKQYGYLNNEMYVPLNLGFSYSKIVMRYFDRKLRTPINPWPPKNTLPPIQ